MGLFRKKSRGEGSAAEAGNPRAAFLEEMTLRLGNHYPGTVITPTEDFGLSLVHPDGATGLLNFHTIWAECQGLDAEQRNKRLDYAVQVARPPQRPTTFVEARPKLLPALRAMSYLGDEHEFVFRPRGLFVAELIAVDEEFGMSFVSRTDLAAWGVDELTAFSAANENFAEVEFGMNTDQAGPKRQVFGPDGFSSSLLKATAVCEQIEAAHGSAVFVAPSREHAYAVFLDDPVAAADALLGVIQEYRELPRQLSPIPYQLVDGELIEWDPPLGHPCRVAVDNAHCMLSGLEYSFQTDALKQRFEATDEDVFVAQASVIDVEGKLVSYSVWPQDVTNGLLPLTDKIAFQVDAADPLLVDFGLAREYVGDLLFEEPACAPPRYRFRSFPSPSIVDRLRSVATDL